MVESFIFRFFIPFQTSCFLVVNFLPCSSENRFFHIQLHSKKFWREKKGRKKRNVAIIALLSDEKKINSDLSVQRIKKKGLARGWKLTLIPLQNFHQHWTSPDQ